MQQWIWNRIAIELPRDWELLQLSKDPDEGRLAFADRTDFRLELSWRRGRRRPDLKRLMADYAARLEAEQGHREARSRRHRRWEGLLSSADGRPQSRFATYFDDARLLVEAALRWTAEREPELERRILESIRPAPPEGSPPLQRWKAFGMEIELPEAFALSECRILPADASLAFAERDQRVAFERRGLVPFWLNGDVADWLRLQLPAEPKRIEATRWDERGHQPVRLAGAIPKGSGLGALFRRQGFDSAAWICPLDQRLYAVRRLGVPKPPAEDAPPPPFTLRCCPSFACSL